jgi:NTP pyrophosphatase (non-canonical NTP hydrolase)
VSEGHDLAREQISKHGKDRYPTPWTQACKVAAELRELMDEINAMGPAAEVPERVRDEYADVGLSYFALGNKLGLDAIEEMRRLVAGDRRSFA